MSFLGGIEAVSRLRLPSVQWRLAVGAIQGLALGVLAFAIAHKIVPFTYPVVAMPLRTLLVLLPILLLLDLGRMRGRWLVVLMTGETLIAGGVTLHNVWQGSWMGSLGLLEGIIFCLLVFIVQVMAFAADRDRSWRPNYATLFEVAWDQAILLSLAALFTAFAWGILLLASALFATIGLPWIGHQLLRPIIRPLITGVTFAGAIGLCIDVEAMVWGARRLVLSLFSMLLPIIGWLSVIFVGALIAVPHTKSWATHTAGWLLSLTATVIVLLLNALFQDGRHTLPPGRLMRISGRVAAVVILPLVILALEPLGVRVATHGWTVERVLAAALLGILAFYGIGYLIAAVRRDHWFGTIACTNVAVAALSAVVFLALLTSLADPRRLAALDQVARLRNGTALPVVSSYISLARDDGQYGRLALQDLIDNPPVSQGTEMQRNARAALAEHFTPLTPGNYNQVTVHPQGSTLPGDLKTAAIGCLRSVHVRCDAIILPATADGISRIAIVSEFRSVEILAKTPGQSWHREGQIFLPARCGNQLAALFNGQAIIGTMTMPALVLDGARYPITSPETGCGN